MGTCPRASVVGGSSMALHVRALTDAEQHQLKHLSQSRTATVRDVERARIILQSSHGQRVPAIALMLDLCEPTVRLRIKRFNAPGMPGLQVATHRGRPRTYSREQMGLGEAARPTDP